MIKHRGAILTGEVSCSPKKYPTDPASRDLDRYPETRHIRMMLVTLGEGQAAIDFSQNSGPVIQGMFAVEAKIRER